MKRFDFHLRVEVKLWDELLKQKELFELSSQLTLSMNDYIALQLRKSVVPAMAKMDQQHDEGDAKPKASKKRKSR